MNPSVHERLRSGKVLLDSIDRRRAEAGDPNIGQNIEDNVIWLVLSDLDESMNLFWAEASKIQVPRWKRDEA